MRPNPPRCVRRTEVFVVMELTDPNPEYEYQFQFKQPHETWENSTVVQAKEGTTTLDDLNPSCSYHIRVGGKILKSGVQSEWVYSEVVAVDTEVPGCTPQPTCTCVLL
jgi:hypothetical protein